jgi:MFS family permease
MMEHRLLKACSSIIGGFLTHLVLGTFYLWGNISLYATSYYRWNGNPGLESATMQYVFPFVYLGIFMGGFMGLPLARRIGHRITSGSIILVYFTSVILASKSSFLEFIITMGFLPGFCVGNEYLIPVDNAYPYYPHRKGIVSGIILCGLGFGSLVFNPLMQYLINPNNEDPLEDGYYSEGVANNLPHALQVCSYIYLGVGLLGVLMMVETKKYTKMEE